MIYIGNVSHGHKVMESIESCYAEVNMQVISRVEDEELLAAVVYENYTGVGGSIEAHIGSFTKRWLNRDFLYIVFDYPFNQLQVKQAFCRVRGKNAASLNWCRSLGFKDLVTIEDVFPDDDMVVLRMKREECRYLNIKPALVKSKRIENGQA